MPIPEPKPGEDKNKFISRCISTLHDMGEFKDQDQRIAVCYSQWEKKDEEQTPIYIKYLNNKEQTNDRL